MGIEEVYIAGGDGKPMRVQQPDARTRVALLQEEKLRRELYPSPKTGKRKGGRPKLSKAEAKPRRGRKPDTDPKEDKKIADAWESRVYRTYAECESALNLKKGDVKRALDRHRKRNKKRTTE